MCPPNLQSFSMSMSECACVRALNIAFQLRTLLQLILNTLKGHSKNTKYLNRTFMLEKAVSVKCIPLFECKNSS